MDIDIYNKMSSLCLHLTICGSEQPLFIYIDKYFRNLMSSHLKVIINSKHTTPWIVPYQSQVF